MRRTIAIFAAVVAILVAGVLFWRQQAADGPALQGLARSMVAASALPSDTREQSTAAGPYLNWTDLPRVSGKSSESVALYMFNYGNLIPGLYRDGVFDGARATTMGKRIKNIPPDLIPLWIAAMKDAAGGFPADRDFLEANEDNNTNFIAVWSIIQTEILWQGDSFVPEQRDHALARLRSVPTDATRDWQNVTGNGSSFEVTQQLLNVEGLFVDDKFDLASFNRALPLARKAYPALAKPET